MLSEHVCVVIEISLSRERKACGSGEAMPKSRRSEKNVVCDSDNLGRRSKDLRVD